MRLNKVRSAARARAGAPPSNSAARSEPSTRTVQCQQGRQPTWRGAACCWYFFQWACEVCIDPFMILYMRSQGVTQQQIGIIFALRFWIGVVFSFLWGLAADLVQAHRTLIVFFILASNATRLPLPFTTTFQGFMFIAISNRIFGSPVNVLADSAVTQRCIHEGEYGRYRLFGTIGWGFMGTPAGLLSDIYGIRALLVTNLTFMVPSVLLSWFLCQPGTLDDRETGSGSTLSTYKADDLAPGKERLHAGHAHADGEAWDSVPIIFGYEDAESSASGLWFDREGSYGADCETKPPAPMKDPSTHKKAVGPNWHELKRQPPPLSYNPAAAEQLPFSRKLFMVFSRPECLVFFWTTIVMGFGLGMVDSYEFLLLKDMGATNALLGFTLTVTCISEVPTFSQLGYLLRASGSADALIDVSMCAYALRMLCYAGLPLLKTPWWVIPVELLHGLTFGCGWGAGCEKNKLLAPPGLEATQQGIFQSLYGVGTGLGALVGGVLAQRVGYQAMFFYGAWITIVSWLLSLVGRTLLNGSKAGAVAYAAVAVGEH